MSLIAEKHYQSYAELKAATTEHHAIVTTVVNQKGGVGKTLLSWTLSNMLAVHRRQGPLKVLLVDLDSQCNSTTRAGVSEDDSGTHEDIYMLLMQVRQSSRNGRSIAPRTAEAIVPTPQGFDMLQGSVDIANADLALFSNDGSAVGYLAQVLEPVKSQYDFIFIDCLPNAGTVQNNAVCAADQLLIPCDKTMDSVQGALNLCGVLDVFRKQNQSHAVLNGVVISDGTVHGKEEKENLDELMGLLEQYHLKPYPPIRHMSAVTNAINNAVPVWDKAVKSSENRKILTEFGNEFTLRTKALFPNCNIME